MVGFSHQLVRQGPESLQERLALARLEARERVAERLVAAVEPSLDVLLAECVQIDDRAALVLGRLAAVDEVVLLQVSRQAARCRQREPELVCQLTDRARPLRPDLDQQGDVPSADRGVAVQERREVGRRPPAPPQPAEHLPEETPELRHLRVVSRHACGV